MKISTISAIPVSFIEYGGLTLAGAKAARTADELRRMSPADGMIAGVGSVNGALFGEEAIALRCHGL